MKSCCFKLYRAYSISFSLLNVGNFFLELNSKRLILVSSVFVPLDQRSKTATAHLAKPACAVRDEESRYGIVKDCIKVQEKKKEVVVLGSSPPKNVKLGIFRRSRAMTAKKSTKKRDARFANLNQLLFCSFRWRRLRRCSDITVRRFSHRSSQFSLCKNFDREIRGIIVRDFVYLPCIAHFLCCICHD